MSKKIKKNVAPTVEEVLAKKKLLEEGFSKLKEEINLSPTQLFLMQIKDLLTIAIKDKISYRKIAIKIEEVYDYKISEQSLRTFVKKNKIGVEVTVPKPKQVEEVKKDNAPVTPVTNNAPMQQQQKEEVKEDRGFLNFGGRR